MESEDSMTPLERLKTMRTCLRSIKAYAAERGTEPIMKCDVPVALPNESMHTMVRVVIPPSTKLKTLSDQAVEVADKALKIIDRCIAKVEKRTNQTDFTPGVMGDPALKALTW